MLPESARQAGGMIQRALRYRRAGLSGHQHRDQDIPLALSQINRPPARMTRNLSRTGMVTIRTGGGPLALFFLAT
jgi:hypothetical protein